jgi:mono/diheme cytochrome c family protein
VKTIAGATLALVLMAHARTANAQNRAAADAGREAYQYWCASCHGRGTGVPGTVALQAKYGGKVPAPLEDRTDLTAATVRFFVRRGVSIMPFFRKTEVSNADLDAIAAYLTRPRGASPSVPGGPPSQPGATTN